MGIRDRFEYSQAIERLAGTITKCLKLGHFLLFPLVTLSAGDAILAAPPAIGGVSGCSGLQVLSVKALALNPRTV